LSRKGNIMSSLRRIKIAKIVLLFGSLVLIFGLGFGAYAASTSKTLSTNFTLINFSGSTANVSVAYYKEDGSPWTASPANTNFTINADGGQKIIRQYFDSTLTAGRGSVVVSSDQPLGAVVQILARDQTPTSGAYSGFIETSDTYYVPLVTRHLSTASGPANSQIIIQNADTTTATVSVDFRGTTTYTKSGISVPVGATYYYDLEEESNLGEAWYGSAVVSSASAVQLAVVSNFFTGPDAMQTFNAFPSSNLGTEWVVPLFTSRLGNGLSSPIAVQNVSGSTLGVGDVDLDCVKDPGSPGSDFTKSNTTPIGNLEAYYFNPVTDLTITSGWYGACRVTATGNVVSFVQMRFLGTGNAASYEAINASSTDTTLFIPLIAKRLANGFATALTVQNLSTTDPAHVTFTYKPSPDYVASGGSASDIVVGPYEIPINASIIHNHRLGGSGSGTGQHNLPDGWFGSLTVTSSDEPIHAFIQLTNISVTTGDTFMAHNAFSGP
jgi:hypothetical protein